jgi:hypothetical protein
MGLHNWRRRRPPGVNRAERLAIGMSGSEFPPPEYRPYTLIPAASHPTGLPGWLILGALLALLAAGVGLLR